MALSNEPEWSLAKGFRPIILSIIWPFTCLTVFSFSYKINRWTGILLVLASGYASWQTATDFSPNDALNEMYIRYILIGGSHALAMACKNPSTSEVPNYVEPTYVSASWNPWYRGWKTLFNIRGVGTNWEVPYLWPGIKHTSLAAKPGHGVRALNVKTKDNIPKGLTVRHNLTAQGKWPGIGIRLCYIALNFLFLIAYYEYLDPNALFAVPPNATDFTADKEGIFRRTFQTLLTESGPASPISPRELRLRALGALDRVLDDFLVISLYHDICAVFWIALGLDESWEWPPIYGQISEAYSMRRFWNMYWHRTFYASANSHAGLISRYVLRIQKRTPVTRVLHAFLVFGISAVMHAMVHARLGQECAWGRAMLVWLLQPVAFVLEGIVQFFWGKVRTRVERLLGIRGVKVMERGFGYAWVVSWLVWEAPKASFPLITCGAEKI